MPKPKAIVEIPLATYQDICRLLGNVSNLSLATRENPPVIGAGMLNTLIESSQSIIKQLEKNVD